MKTPNAPASMKNRTSTESHKYRKLPPWGVFLCYHRPKAVPVYGESGHERSEWPKGERLEDAKLSCCSPSDNPPKLSPGWNKVALLTAVRNSPCSCPFSVSLHPPQAALNSKPRMRWRLLRLAIKNLNLAPPSPSPNFPLKISVQITKAK